MGNILDLYRERPTPAEVKDLRQELSAVRQDMILVTAEKFARLVRREQWILDRLQYARFLSIPGSKDI